MSFLRRTDLGGISGCDGSGGNYDSDDARKRRRRKEEEKEKKRGLDDY